MGAGKTTALIEMCKNEKYSEHGDRRFIVVVPLLSEVQRIKNAVDCEEPLGNKKIISIQTLIKMNKNIVCTHSLFNSFDKKIRDLISNSAKKYDLYHDEQPSLFQGVIASGWQVNTTNELVQNITKDDLSLLFKTDMLKRVNSLENDNFHDGLIRMSRVIPSEVFKSSKTVYNSLLKYMEDNALYTYGENSLDKNSPANLLAFTDICNFDIYNEVWIFSYLIKDGLLNAYFDLNFIDNESRKYYHIENNKITEGYLEQYPSGLWRIVLCEDEKYNHNKKLSKTSYMKMKQEEFNNIARLFVNYLKSGTYDKGRDKKESEYYYTTFKDFLPKIRRNYYKKIAKDSFLANNAKGTNDYQDRCIVACLCAKFTNPALSNFFNKLGIGFNEELFSLSELVQFIWRSNIRVQDSNKKVYVYIPCEDMRTLFNTWLVEGLKYQRNI